MLDTPLRVHEDKKRAKLDELREQIVGVLAGLDRRGLLGDMVFCADYASLDTTLQGVFPERESFAASVAYMVPMTVTETSGLPRRRDPVEVSVDVPIATDIQSFMLRDEEGKILAPLQTSRPWMRIPFTLTWHHLWYRDIRIPLSQCTADQSDFFDATAKSLNCRNPIVELPPADLNDDGFLDYPDRNSLALYMKDWFDPRWSFRIKLRSRGMDASKVSDNARIKIKLHELIDHTGMTCKKGIDQNSFIVTDRLGDPVDHSVSLPDGCKCDKCIITVDWKLGAAVDHETVLTHWLYFNTLDVELPAADCPSFTANVQKADSDKGKCIIGNWMADPPNNGDEALTPRKSVGAITVDGNVETTHSNIHLARDADYVEVPFTLASWRDAQTYEESRVRNGISIIRFQPVRLDSAWRFRWHIRAERVNRSVEFRGFVSAAPGTCVGYECVTLEPIGGGDRIGQSDHNPKDDTYYFNEDVAEVSDDGFYLCTSTMVSDDANEVNDIYDLFELNVTVRDEAVDVLGRVWRNTLPNIFINLYKPQTRNDESGPRCKSDSSAAATWDSPLFNDDASSLISFESGRVLAQKTSIGTVRSNNLIIWSKVPGSHELALRRALIEILNLDWVKTADIKKTGEDTILDISAGSHWTKITLEKDYILRWSKIPGADNGRLKNYLRGTVGLSWADSAEFKKIDNDKAIEISSDTNTVELRLAADEKSATLTTGGKTYVLLVKKKGSDSILQIEDLKHNTVNKVTLTGSDGKTRSLSYKHENGELLINVQKVSETSDSTEEAIDSVKTGIAIAPYPSSYASILPNIPFINSAGNYRLQRKFYLYYAMNSVTLPKDTVSLETLTPTSWYTLEASSSERAPRVQVTWRDDFRPRQSKEYYLSFSVGTEESDQGYDTDLEVSVDRQCYDCLSARCATYEDCKDYTDGDGDNIIDEDFITNVTALNNTPIDIRFGICNTETPSKSCDIKWVAHEDMNITQHVFSNAGNRTAIVDETGPVYTTVRMTTSSPAVDSRDFIRLYHDTPYILYSKYFIPHKEDDLPSITGSIAIPIYNITVMQANGVPVFDVDEVDFATHRDWFADWGYPCGNVGVCTITYAILSGNAKKATFSQDRWHDECADVSGITVIEGTPKSLVAIDDVVVLSTDHTENTGEDVNLRFDMPHKFSTEGTTLTIKVKRAYTAYGGRINLTLGMLDNGDSGFFIDTWGDGDIEDWTTLTYDLEDKWGEKPFKYLFLFNDDSDSVSSGNRSLYIDSIRVEGSGGTNITLVPTSDSPLPHEAYPFLGSIRVFKEDHRESDDFFRRRTAPFLVEMERPVTLDGGTPFPSHKINPSTTTATATYTVTSNNRRIGFAWVKLSVWSNM